MFLPVNIEPENSTTMKIHYLFIFYSYDSEDSDSLPTFTKSLELAPGGRHRPARTSHGMCQNCASRSDIIESVSLLPNYFPTVAVMMENIYGEPK